MMTVPPSLRFPSWLGGALLLLGLGWARAQASAGDLPAGYVVHDDTTSPDERYGILVPEDDDADGKGVNSLADLNEERVLGAIKGFGYHKDFVRANLRAVWAKDSTWCVAEFGEKFGFVAVAVLEPAGKGLSQVEIGGHIQRTLNGAIARKARGGKINGNASAAYRLGPGRLLRVRAWATTNPRKRDGVPSEAAAFAGTFDAKARRWLTSSARPISDEDEDATGTAYQEYEEKDFLVVPPGTEPPEGAGGGYPNETARTFRLDEILNQVYRIVRSTLPPARFAGVKAEQIAWLKRRDALPTDETKAMETLARIKVLQDLLW